jgi:hypothetical protein
MEYAAPQIADRAEPFRSKIREHLKGHTQALENLAVELLARGLSVRDIEDAFKDESGRLLLSRTAVSELGERLWEDYHGFAQRDLSEHGIVHLFVDGIAERLRPGQKREPVLAAWGFMAEGRKVLLHLMAGSKEDAGEIAPQGKTDILGANSTKRICEGNRLSKLLARNEGSCRAQYLSKQEALKEKDSILSPRPPFRQATLVSRSYHPVAVLIAANSWHAENGLCRNATQPKSMACARILSSSDPVMNMIGNLKPDAASRRANSTPEKSPS